MSSQPNYNWKPCDRCEAAGFKGIMIRFEKIGEDPATGKIKWKLIERVTPVAEKMEYTEKEHVHKGTAPRKKPRISEIIYQGEDIEQVNKLLKISKDNELFAALPSFGAKPVTYVIVRREFI